MVTAEVMNQILSFFSPADKMLQNRSCSLIAGYEIVKKTITQVEKLRNAFEFKKIAEKLPSALSKPTKHRRVASSRLEDYIVDENISVGSENLNLEASYFEIIVEFRKRFSEFNMSLVISLCAPVSYTHLTLPTTSRV